MFGHLPELGIILVIALIFFGPEKLPEVAASAGKMIREVRQAMDTALRPEDTQVPDDFSTYYYESLARTGEVPAAEAETDPFSGWPGVAGPEAMDAESISADSSESESETEYEESDDPSQYSVWNVGGEEDLDPLAGETEDEPAATPIPPEAHSSEPT